MSDPPRLTEDQLAELHHGAEHHFPTWHREAFESLLAEVREHRERETQAVRLTENPCCWQCSPNYRLMLLCPLCGNKRCPHANSHDNPCTGSNDPGQPGSAYPLSAQETKGITI